MKDGPRVLSSHREKLHRGLKAPTTEGDAYGVNDGGSKGPVVEIHMSNAKFKA
jgi:hypothetical protein